MANANPWDRREFESSKAYEAFCTYRDMGTQRSLSKVSEKLQKSETLMGRWSRTYDWVERAAAWDEEEDRIAREIARKEQAEEIKKMRKRHADVATAMIMKAARALNRLKEEEIRPNDISRMMEVASKLERISRGDVGEVIEERDGGQATPSVTFYIPDNQRDKKEEEQQ